MDAITELKSLDHEIILLNHAVDTLRWDQETYMPEAAIAEKAEQVALLQGLVHDRVTSSRQGALFAQAGVTERNKAAPPGPDDASRAFLREAYRRYSKQVKTPKALVEELAKTQSLAQAEWIKARRASDFALFQPYMEKLVELLKKYSSCQGYTDQVYDPLLDEYEPWMTTRELESLFDGLTGRLVPLYEKIRSSEKQGDDEVLRRSFPVERQRIFGLEVVKAMGFDFSRGRLDVSAHPFTTTLGCDDVRLTTRYNEHFLPSAVFGNIHEGGHGLYEQGFAPALRPSLLAAGTSLGIHESQSRLWENMVGRSRGFWRHFFPRLRELFPEALAGVDGEAFYRAVNTVRPSLIRVEADEVTYNLHIILRFTLEKKIFGGKLGLDELPSAWEAESERLLGIKPGTAAEGVLQDVHWSMGAFGYFPTYTLGNLAAAQLFATLRTARPSTEAEIERGELNGVLGWLRDNVHGHGSVYPAQALLKRVTGETLSSGAFMDYLETKYGELYDL